MIFHNREFNFSPNASKGNLSEKLAVDDISDVEAEEYMMRFYGLFTPKSKAIIQLIMSLYFKY